MRGGRGPLRIAGGVIAPGAYGSAAAFRPDPGSGRIPAAHSGAFTAGSPIWGMVMDGFRPDRRDVAGALIRLTGVAVIMYAPRG
ncbi:YnfA family protein [Streptosporangium minutum]|uniref:YnfA family protein n=1 Tax=Streptosporangium minutum TaxID=569862 RepID=UPI003100CF8F